MGHNTKFFTVKGYGPPHWCVCPPEILRFNTNFAYHYSELVQLYDQVAHSRTLQVNLEEEALLVLQGQVLCGCLKNQHNVSAPIR